MLAYVLTFGRVVLAAGFAVVVAWWTGAARPETAQAAVLLAIAVAAELTDIFDGVAARRAGTAGELGGLLDPLCDSLGRLTIYFAMALAGWVSLAVPFVMAGRDIVVAYARIVCAATGQATGARLSGKVKAIVQGGGVAALLVLAWGGQGWGWGWRASVEAALIAVTAWSLADYVAAAWPAVRKMAKR